MTTFDLTVVAAGAEAEERWAQDLSRLIDKSDGGSTVRVRGRTSSGGEIGQIVFVDGQWIGAGAEIEKLDRRGRAVFLIVPESSGVPKALSDGRVDDVLVHPFRPLELLSKLRHYERVLMWEEVSRMNETFSQLIGRLREDLQLAERLQKSKLPARFPDVPGMKAHSRYLAGMRSGGDHFDIAESRDKSRISVVLTDSSSYGLSSSVLGALMSVAVKLSSDEIRSCSDTVGRIHAELVATLGQKDRLSMFYGVISRRDLSLRYLNLGTSSAFHAPAGEAFRPLAAQAGPITQAGGLPNIGESEVKLGPDDRLALISDGFVDAAGGPSAMCNLLDRFRKRDALDAINEMVFSVKSKFTEPDDMPEQDCTAVLFDVDSRVLRLA